MKIDKTTGLPEVPEGHFWRIHQDGTWGYLCLCLKERQPRWYNKNRAVTVDSRWLDHGALDESDDPKSYIRAEAVKLLEGVEANLKRAKRRKAIADLLGDYPPKSLDAS